MGFVGVSTASSSIMRVFPRWAEILGLPTRQLVGLDLPIGAPAEDYRALVASIRADPRHQGTLVTTHKLNVYAAARDLFDELDDFARLCGEVSSIFKRGGSLVGHAKDPVTAGLALEEFLPADVFGAGAHAVCLGAGGAGVATTYYLAQRPARPRRIVCTDVDGDRLAHLRAVHARAGLDPSLFAYVRVTSAADSDRVVAAAPPGSLIVNATGLGKDRPGSPLTGACRLQRRALVWDLNYRGDLTFLAQARRQRRERDLVVVDGWRYFIHSWSQAVAEVFGVPLTAPLVDALAAAAWEVR
jgi:shikimate 5-dehydrogenase